jgi:diguanylate cyclase
MGFALTYSSRSEILKARGIEELHGVKIEAAAVSEQLLTRQMLFSSLARHLGESVETSPNAVAHYLASKPVALKMYPQLIAVGREQQVLASFRDATQTLERLPVGLKDELAKVLISGQRAVFSQHIDPDTDEPVVLLIEPMLIEGKVTGALIGSMALGGSFGSSSESQFSASDVRNTTTPLSVTVDQHGHILTHPLSSRRGALLSTEQGFGAVWSSASLQHHMSGQRPSADVVAFDSADSYLVVSAPVIGTGWSVWRRVPMPAVMAPINTALRFSFQLTAVLVLILVGLWWFAVHLVMQPVDQLHRKALQLLAENGREPVLPWPQAKGEIGDLGRVLQAFVEQRLAAEQSQNGLQQQLESMMEASPISFAFTREQKFERVSRSFSELFDASPEHLIGLHTREIYAASTDFDQLGQRVGQVFQNQRQFDEVLAMQSFTGRAFLGRLKGRPVNWNDRGFGTIWTVEDVTDQQAMQQKLERAATIDALTGLFNRSQMEGYLQRLIEEPTRRTASILVMFDLDRFKAINDTHGHQAGDAVLQEVASQVRHQVRAHDMVGRLGGDEFIVLLEGCEEEFAAKIGLAIQQAISSIRLPWNGQALSVGASLGLAPFQDHYSDLAHWIRAADLACYQAKSSGGARVVVARAKATQGAVVVDSSA